jgi:myo-inositol-1(or 4)-monophosphatase
MMSSSEKLELTEIERLALELATLAGARITTALGRTLSVRYKQNREKVESLRDPVSEVDEAVEELIREHVGTRFPDHDILGEESEARPARDQETVWAIDPVDGTANFVSGFPLFAASIGILHRGRPVAGAVWCATSHALRPGVYHARAGERLGFDSEVLERALNPAVRRRLAALGSGLDAPDMPWDLRRTGSAAIECAFLAAGLLQVARFDRPNVWDVAGGIALVQAAGGVVLEKSDGQWVPFEAFEIEGDLRNWSRPIILGSPEAVEALRARS